MRYWLVGFFVGMALYGLAVTCHAIWDGNRPEEFVGLLCLVLNCACASEGIGQIVLQREDRLNRYAASLPEGK
jgi:hypothetical protein